MRLKTFNTGEMAGGGKRLALVFSLAAALGGCDTLSSINPFDRPEVYKPEVLPTVPADKLYNEGLARLQNG
ncbi:MAG: outer membrane protein assembly factor BamD, partial [Bosea sp.]|nr:outer membrane protein assembly factor BamD [Bosea sp. (in: a-proteobacteria)]